MVRLTDSHAEALALVGTGTLTPKQIASVLDVFSDEHTDTSMWRGYRHGSLDAVSLTFHSFVDNMCVCLTTTIADEHASIESIVRGFIWGDVCKVFDVELKVGGGSHDYQLYVKSKDSNIWGAFHFTLTRTPYEVID